MSEAVWNIFNSAFLIAVLSLISFSFSPFSCFLYLASMHFPLASQFSSFLSLLLFLPLPLPPSPSVCLSVSFGYHLFCVSPKCSCCVFTSNHHSCSTWELLIVANSSCSYALWIFCREYLYGLWAWIYALRTQTSVILSGASIFSWPCEFFVCG